MTNLNRARKPRLLLLFLAVAVGVVVAFACWPRPKVEAFTSRTFHTDGKAVRFQALVPRGWESCGHKYMVQLVPIEPILRISYPLNRWVGPGDLLGSELRMGPSKVAGLQKGSTDETRVYHDEHEPSIQFAERTVTFDGVAYNIRYSRSNPVEFDATYRQICQSFRVMK